MMNGAMGGGAARGAPPTFSAPSGPLSRPALPGPLSGGVSPHLSPGQFPGPVQGTGGFPVIPPGVQGSAFPLAPGLKPRQPLINAGPHLPPDGVPGGGATPGLGPTIL